MLRFDLHVHTDLSPCSRLTVAELLAHARGLGLDGVCITDHHTMAAARSVTEGVQPDGLCVVVGMEYSTDQGDFLIFGPFEELRPGLTAEALLRLVDRAGGVAVAAHPFRPGREVPEALVRRGLCRVVEGRNGRNRPGDDARVRAWERAHGVGVTAGSDAHRLAELGRVATRFDAPVRSRADLIAALRRGGFRPDLRPVTPSRAPGSAAPRPRTPG
ncbi:PHP-associated domain-containing protein [Deferrisoma camini]|uniref:PHP-associated domain-containing protein n=1 Tax=Deferrisoma camini TaxID=1035120 RepID=UPI00046D71B4|nr:PHP domain-containing protein [Deferrisoma camini]